MEADYLFAAAEVVDAQASQEPTRGIPVDPDVADFMGAFEEDALTLDDLDDVGEASGAGHGQE